MEHVYARKVQDNEDTGCAVSQTYLPACRLQPRNRFRERRRHRDDGIESQFVFQPDIYGYYWEMRELLVRSLDRLPNDNQDP